MRCTLHHIIRIRFANNGIEILHPDKVMNHCTGNWMHDAWWMVYTAKNLFFVCGHDILPGLSSHTEWPDWKTWPRWRWWTRVPKCGCTCKSCKTRVCMGLYDPRNLTGPLLTSLWPALNAHLQKMGVQSETTSQVFWALSGGKALLSGDVDWDRIFGSQDSTAVLDYYEFIQLIGGQNAVEWRW